MIVSLDLEENSTLNAKVWEAAGLQGNGTFPLDRFSYNNSALLEVIFRHVQATSFNGITVSEWMWGHCTGKGEGAWMLFYRSLVQLLVYTPKGVC